MSKLERKHYKPFRAVLTRPELDDKTDEYVSHIRLTMSIPLFMKVNVQTEDVTQKFNKMKTLIKQAIDNLDLSSDELDENAH